MKEKTLSLSGLVGAWGFKLGLRLKNEILKVAIFLKDHGQYIETSYLYPTAPRVSFSDWILWISRNRNSVFGGDQILWLVFVLWNVVVLFLIKQVTLYERKGIN